ncbi:MAG: hypothetical protein M1820_002566 [Bogoriella megaspora]|nr:MAG: hypothetical protein M1820_002566 [Bogoriella megaspora]
MSAARAEKLRAPQLRSMESQWPQMHETEAASKASVPKAPASLVRSSFSAQLDNPLYSSQGVSPNPIAEAGQIEPKYSLPSPVVGTEVENVPFSQGPSHFTGALLAGPTVMPVSSKPVGGNSHSIPMSLFSGVTEFIKGSSPQTPRPSSVQQVTSGVSQLNAAFTSGSQTVTASDSFSPHGITATGKQTLNIAGSAQAINGQAVSLGSGGPSIGDGIGGLAFSLASALGSGRTILVDGQTLAPGSGTTINNVPVRAIPNENILRVGTSEVAFDSLKDLQSIVIGSLTMHVSYASSDKEINLHFSETQHLDRPTSISKSFKGLISGGIAAMVNGKTETLYPGQAVTIDGTPLSLVSGDSAVVIAGKTKALHSGASATEMGNYVASGIGESRVDISGPDVATTSLALGSEARSKRDKSTCFMVLYFFGVVIFLLNC